MRNNSCKEIWDCVYGGDVSSLPWIACNNNAEVCAFLQNHVVRKNGEEIGVLDVGCGTGDLAVKLADNFHSVIGVDVSQNAIDKCNALPYRRNVKFMVGDVLDNRLPSKLKLSCGVEAFDIVVAQFLLHEIEGDEIDEVCNCLSSLVKPNGWLYLSWLVQGNDCGRRVREGLYAGKVDYKVTYYSRDEIAKKFDEIDFCDGGIKKLLPSEEMMALPRQKNIQGFTCQILLGRKIAGRIGTGVKKGQSRQEAFAAVGGSSDWNKICERTSDSIFSWFLNDEVQRSGISYNVYINFQIGSLPSDLVSKHRLFPTSQNSTVNDKRECETRAGFLVQYFRTYKGKSVAKQKLKKFLAHDFFRTHARLDSEESDSGWVQRLIFFWGHNDHNTRGKGELLVKVNNGAEELFPCSLEEFFIKFEINNTYDLESYLYFIRAVLGDVQDNPFVDYVNKVAGDNVLAQYPALDSYTLYNLSIPGHDYIGSVIIESWNGAVLLDVNARECIKDISYATKLTIQGYRYRVKSIESAIGSIMSRNGSHNIGSHVLAALSHNVGTMPDDRVLYQYIQHRMDYIATATTDRPQWRQPTMFVSCLMKEFLKQKHLLEHISGSEGLHAYKFQSQTVACEQSYDSETVQQNTICIHIRRIIPDAVGNTDMDWEGKHFLNQRDGAVDFIGYDKSEMQNLLYDVALAIPGGVIGHHAFYTIIENILRNAAKHEWAESMRIWKVAVDTLGEETCKKEFGACLPRNLDLYIDFRDNPIKGKIECRVWNDKVVSVSETARIRTAVLKSLVLHSDKAECRGKLAVVAKLLLHWYRLVVNMPSVVDNALFKLIGQVARSHDKTQEYNADSKICDSIVESLTTKGRKLLGEGNVAILDFIRTSIMCEDDQVKTELQNKIDLSFIDEDTGALRKENWGIAEMRISAGFLQCRETEHIGGLPGADSPLSIIRPILVENQNHDKCVAYRFDVDKPKLLLVVLSSKHKREEVKTINENSARCGVTFIKYSDLKDGGAYPYSYTLFESLDETGIERLASRKLMLPFRILCASAPRATKFSHFVPTFTGDFFTHWADKYALKLKESGDSAVEVCYSLFESVCADWLKHVQSRGLPRKKGRPEIVIYVGDGASSLESAQTLISRFELLRFIFENTFNAAVRSFLKENGPEAGTGSVMPVKNDKEGCTGGRNKSGIPEVISLPQKMAALLLAISQMESREIATDQKLADELGIGKRELLASATDIVQAQLRLWIRDEVLNTNQSVRIEMDDPELKTIWGKALKTGEEVFVGTLSSLYDNDICRYWLTRFVKYISTVILEQADSFLRKYEERFCTLPKMPLNEKRAVDDGKLPCSLQMSNGFIQKIKVTNDPYDRSQALKNHDICYFRHGTDIQSAIMDNYYEPLSGAQSTFSAFMSLKQDMMEIESGFATTKKKDVHCRVAGFVTQLIENAAFRILIVDERVKKFMNAHSEVMDHLNGLRIAVADDTDPGVIQMFSSGFDDAMPKFSGVSLNDFEVVIIHQGIIDKLLLGHEDKLEVEKWMGRLIEKLHYVVITTGRGTPANIPDTARVLPYSIIESSILQRFPEKMILVDAVMNILPVRHHARNVND